MFITGNALVWMQRVHKPTDLWDTITFLHGPIKHLRYFQNKRDLKFSQIMSKIKFRLVGGLKRPQTWEGLLGYKKHAP